MFFKVDSRIIRRVMPFILAFAMALAMAVPAAAQEGQAAESDVDVPAELDSIGYGICGENAYWFLANGTLTIKGSGAVYDYESDNAPWHDYIDVIDTVIINNGITAIGECAFWGCDKLTSVTVSESILDIRSDAFRDCTAITYITIPGSVRYIRSDAFNGCTSLKNIVIPESTSIIGYGAFSYCSSLTSISVDESNEYYDSRSDCNAIIEKDTNTLIAGCCNTVIPEDVAAIARFAFAGCTSLTDIAVPSSVVDINDDAFQDCTGLTEVTLENGLQFIGDSSFYGCEKLSSIAIPQGVTVIGDDAFGCCSSLKNMTVPSTVTSIGEDIFLGCTKITYIKCHIAPSLVDYASFYTGSRNTVLYLYQYDGWTSAGVTKFTADIDPAFAFPGTVQFVNTSFTDVTEPELYYYKAVYWAASNKITMGYTSTDSLPDGYKDLQVPCFGAGVPCNRQDFTLFLYRTAGKPGKYDDGTVISASDADVFPDVADSGLSDLFKKAIAWAVKKGVINGYDDGTFGVNKTITRKEALIMMYRYAGRPAVKNKAAVRAFVDVQGVLAPYSDSYKAIAWAAEKGITKGYTSVSSLPDGYKDQELPCFGCDIECYRQDMITFLYRAFGG